MLPASANPLEALPAHHDEARRCLLRMRVAARSVLGAEEWYRIRATDITLHDPRHHIAHPQA
ncbi:hypothetical protein [Actinoallomurus sp. CA-150999]|uniref:hypothetical protein n=1 Tax=Actinoallomurus sp. CA-150999 TaxID=3239887 RepID=UPI003D8FCF88